MPNSKQLNNVKIILFILHQLIYHLILIYQLISFLKKVKEYFFVKTYTKIKGFLCEISFKMLIVKLATKTKTIT